MSSNATDEKLASLKRLRISYPRPRWRSCTNEEPANLALEPTACTVEVFVATTERRGSAHALAR